MKVYISVDMEGITNVVHWSQVTPGHHEYTAARKWMMAETNAAIEGALAGGAKDVIVNDAHNGMRNILGDALHPRARLISGDLKDLGMMAGIDDTFDAVFFIGYHARGGNFGVLAHTWSSSVLDVRLNNVSVGEWALNALIAGDYRVPVVLVTGDNYVIKEVTEGLPGPFKTVTVKQALSKFSALSLSRHEAEERIRDAARQALQCVPSARPFTLQHRITLEVDFHDTHLADSAAMLPQARRVGPITVQYEARSGTETFSAFYSFMALAQYAQ